MGAVRVKVKILLREQVVQCDDIATEPFFGYDYVGFL